MEKGHRETAARDSKKNDCQREDFSRVERERSHQLGRAVSPVLLHRYDITLTPRFQGGPAAGLQEDE